jgi:hypothetical protein
MIQNRSKVINNPDPFSFVNNNGSETEYSPVKRGNRKNTESAQKIKKTSKQSSLKIEIDDAEEEPKMVQLKPTDVEIANS